MSNKKYLLIDGDDTLWEENLLYRNIVNDLSALISTLFAQDQEKVLSKLIYKLKHQDSPLMQTYKDGADIFIDTLEQISVSDFSLSLNDNSVSSFFVNSRDELRKYTIILKEAVIDVMPILANRYNCVFYSQGRRDIQLIKLKNSPLEKYFYDIFITEHKDADNLESYLKSHNIGRFFATVIGNSPRHDINPACSIGVQSIYLESPYTWARDLTELLTTDPKPRVAANFHDVLNLLDGK